MVQQPIWKRAVHVQPRQPMAEIALAVYSNIPIASTAIATSISASLDANAKFDPLILRHGDVLFGNTALDLNCTTRSIYGTCEFG
jgi:hypothetical protein